MIILNHFKSDLINNMEKMRIPGTKPSSVPYKCSKKYTNKMKAKGMV